MQTFLFIWLFLLQAVTSPGPVGLQQPIEEQHNIHYGWWLIGVLIVIAAGMGLYVLIKKDPRKDAVR